jgi:hypothetical protein
MKGTTFWKEEDDDDNNTSINKQQNNEGEKAKGRWFYVIFLGFVMWWVLFFPLNFCQAQKVFYFQESGYYLQIKHNIRFLPQSERFCYSFGFFLIFVMVLKK